jgi:hypothetical protein
MIRVSEAVEQILYEDGFVLEALQRGILNISAYAKEIHKAVEVKTMKPVRMGTIVVALSRIADNARLQNFSPNVVLDSFSVTTSISEITFERTAESLERLITLSNSFTNSGDFFTITEGLHEITIICSENVRDTIRSHFGIKPKVVIDDLVAVSVRFSTDYLDIPNTIYALVGALATRHINVMEIISTYTELTFIVYKNEMEKTIRALNTYSQKTRSS